MKSQELKRHLGTALQKLCLSQKAKRAPDSEERTIWNTTVTLTVTTGHSVGAASLVYVRSGARWEALIVRRANK